MQVLLMVILGKEELRCAEISVVMAPKPASLSCAPNLGFFGGDGLGFLLLAGCINPRTVLGAVVIALAHPLGGVVAFPEGLEDGGAVDLAWVKDNQDRLIMTRHAGADLFVGRVLGHAGLVANRSKIDTIKLPELALRTPETSHADVETLKALWIGSAKVAVVDGVGKLHRHRCRALPRQSPSLAFQRIS